MDFTAETNTSFIKEKIGDLEKMTDQDNPYTVSYTHLTLPTKA